MKAIKPHFYGRQSFLSAASAPQAAAGLFLITATVPDNVIPGPAVPIMLTAGAAQSQAGVTVAVQ